MTPLPITRRHLLRQSAATLLGANLWPGTLAADAPAAKPFSFLVVNDIHAVDKKCTAWLEGVIKTMKARPEQPDLCLLAGDLSEHGTAPQLTSVRDTFKAAGLAVKVVIGNHDWKTNTDRKAYEQTFPDSLNYTFEHHGWQFLALDSSHGLRARVAMQSATLKWLDAKLPKLDRKKPLILLTHFPLGPKVPNRLTNADAVLARFKMHNLRAIFGGHHHGLTERKSGQIVMTTNRCCSLKSKNHDGSKQKGYFVCTVKDGAIARTFVEVKVP